MGSHASKQVLDYNGERQSKAMLQYVEQQMPNYVERIAFPSDYKKIKAKAAKFGLPRAMLFASKGKTSALMKFLSTIFRRRLLIVHVAPTVKNQELMEGYGVTPPDLPVLLIVKAGFKPVKYTSRNFNRRELERFFKEHANQDPTYHPVEVVVEEDEEEEPIATNTDGLGPDPIPAKEEEEEPIKEEDESESPPMKENIKVEL